MYSKPFFLLLDGICMPMIALLKSDSTIKIDDTLINTLVVGHSHVLSHELR